MIYDQILSKIDPITFDTHTKNHTISYYPEYLKHRFSEWINLYGKFYSDNQELMARHLNPNIDIRPNTIQLLLDALIGVVFTYYQGKVFNATGDFNNSLDNLLFNDQTLLHKIKRKSTFYRARKSEKLQFKNSDLFHVPFESRGYISTNRYSIPGYPALYIADSTYTCWEEFERADLNKLNFARIQNEEDLLVVNIQLFSDFKKSIMHLSLEDGVPLLQKYIVIFPLILACTCKVKEGRNTFKPEYIIPQLLLQYISSKPNIDGIRFPSSKINYDILYNIEGYNYIFPVRSEKRSGYCDHLKRIFNSTEPTSLELEDLLYNSEFTVARTFMNRKSNKYIELIPGVKKNYSKTSFGKIESILLKRNTKKVQENLEIISARYYTNQSSVDVSDQVRKKTINNGLKFIINNDIVNGKDPDYGVEKKFEIKYILNGLEKTRVLNEHEVIEI